MSPRRTLLACVATVALAAGLALFEPWTLVTDEVVAQPIPPASVPAPAPAASSAAPAAGTADAPDVLATGTFVSHEHGTTGTVRVLGLADGRRVLRIEGLETSNGPDLRVWLSDAPVLTGRRGWFVFDDGDHVDLGELAGNRGDQNYEIPAEVDLDRLRSVSVWCARFRVSFGAAALTANP